MSTIKKPKKLKYLTVKEKFEIIQRKENNESVKAIVEALKCKKTQVYNVIKNKEKIKHDYFTIKNVNRKKLRIRIPNQKLNMCVYDWFLAAKSQNFPLTGPIVQNKAREIAKLMKINRFSGSNGWLESFKKRNGIINFSSADNNKLDPEQKQSCLNEFQHIIDEHCISDINNVNETEIVDQSTFNTTYNNQPIYSDPLNTDGHCSSDNLFDSILDQRTGKFIETNKKKRKNKQNCDVKKLKIENNDEDIKKSTRNNVVDKNKHIRLRKCNSAFKKTHIPDNSDILSDNNSFDVDTFDSCITDQDENISTNRDSKLRKCVSKNYSGIEDKYNISDGEEKNSDSEEKKNVSLSDKRLSTINRTECDENDEFDIFGQSIAMQLRKLPLKFAIELQNKFQNMITKKRLDVLKSNENEK